jgi:hypothetical protein
MYASYEQTSSALGSSKFYGGVDRLAQYINHHPIKEENDMSKFDARLVPWLRNLIMEFRWRMLRASDRTPENRLRLEYQYREEIWSLMATTTGFLLTTDHGLKSGSDKTSSDGTLCHFAATAFSFLRLVGNDYARFKRDVRLKIAGDDEIMSMTRATHKLFSAAQRAPFYEMCGIHFKLEVSKVSENLEGMTFLGMKFQFDTESGRWVGVPAEPRKMVASLLKPHKRQTPGQTLTRAIALLTESYWHVPTRNLLHGFVQDLSNRGIQPQDAAEDPGLAIDYGFIAGTVPTLRRIRGLWLGEQ